MRSCWVCSIDPVGNSCLNKSQSKIAILTNSVHSPSLSFSLYHSIYFIVSVEGKSAKSSSDRKSSN